MGRNIVTSSLLSIPILVIGKSFCNFPPHWEDSSNETRVVHCYYVFRENFKGAFIYLARNAIFKWGFLFSELPITFLISTLVNCLASAVLVGVCDCNLARR